MGTSIWTPAPGCGTAYLAGVGEPVVLDGGRADGDPACLQEDGPHATAYHELVHSGYEVLEDGDLVGDLCAAEDGREGASWGFQNGAEGVDFALHEESGCGREELGYALGGGVGAVGRPEGVVDIYLGEGCQFLREFRVVGLFPRMKSQVLQHQDAAGRHAVNDGCNLWAYAVGGGGYGTSDYLGEPVSYGLDAELLHDPALWPAHV